MDSVLPNPASPAELLLLLSLLSLCAGGGWGGWSGTVRGRDWSWSPSPTWAWTRSSPTQPRQMTVNPVSSDLGTWSLSTLVSLWTWTRWFRISNRGKWRPWRLGG